MMNLEAAIHEVHTLGLLVSGDSGPGKVHSGELWCRSVLCCGHLCDLP